MSTLIRLTESRTVNADAVDFIHKSDLGIVFYGNNRDGEWSKRVQFTNEIAASLAMAMVHAVANYNGGDDVSDAWHVASKSAGIVPEGASGAANAVLSGGCSLKEACERIAEGGSQ